LNIFKVKLELNSKDYSCKDEFRVTKFLRKNPTQQNSIFKMGKGTNFTLKSLDRILRIYNISVINFFHGFEKETGSLENIESSERINKILEILKFLNRNTVNKLVFQIQTSLMLSSRQEQSLA